jgi:hypothetical protein
MGLLAGEGLPAHSYWEPATGAPDNS